MIITNRTLSRRTLLRGVGATLALPLLDSMVPVFAAAANTAIRAARRLGVIYVPNGIMMDKFTPAAEGDGFELTPILEPLAAFRDRLLVLSGLSDTAAIPLPGEGAGDHARAAATFLTGVHARKTEGADIRAGVSMDQVAARELGRETQLASLELTLESPEMVGACDAGYSCAYSNTISWRSPTTPLPMEIDPRAVFERLFGDGDSTDRSARLARIAEQRSILDMVTGKVTALQRSLGPHDRLKVNEYLEAIRDVERRIQKAEEQSARELPVVEKPAGSPSSFGDQAKLMFDLLALAYQADLTRVSTLMIGHEVSSRAYPEIGVRDPHHPLSHHQGDKEKIAKVIQVNIYHMQLFAYFLEKLRSTPDGEGSLLDHVMLLYGGGISDGNLHSHVDLPILLLGAGGEIRGGRHVRYPKGTPLANLHVTLLGHLGVPVETLGEGSGRVEL
jgi:hypothetical protein